MAGSYQSQSHFTICPYKKQQLFRKISMEYFSITSILFFGFALCHCCKALSLDTDFRLTWLVLANCFIHITNVVLCIFIHAYLYKFFPGTVSVYQPSLAVSVALATNISEILFSPFRQRFPNHAGSFGNSRINSRIFHRKNHQTFQRAFCEALRRSLKNSILPCFRLRSAQTERFHARRRCAFQCRSAKFLSRTVPAARHSGRSSSGAGCCTAPA